MLVYLYEYRRDDAGETVRHGEEVVDTDAEEYFGTDEPGPDEEWERIDAEGEVILRKASTHDDVAAVAMPEEEAESDDSGLPGRTLQIRTAGGDSYFVEQAEIVEAIDDDP